ncbi:hypothetical protein [Halomicrobium salinisoli]|uniref:hypothetical protein n=1 Tax=Halomicrobium salinisoli TaxID=2878391 RepID=UPI001CF070FC|nr:hypothetical protein [Halomicrobium salinisoli]
MTGWPVEIDGREYWPVPESWIEHGVDADEGQGPPRVYAVSVCLYRNRMRVRYAHPNTDGVMEMETTPIQHGDGLVPTGLAKPGSVWHRSIVPTVDAQDVIRAPEREHLEDVWKDRLLEDDPDAGDDGERLIADGGQVGDGMERESVTEIVSNGGRDSDGSPRMLSRWTFQYSPARQFVEKRLKGRVLNACAGRTKLNHDGEIVRNDLNPEVDADHHLDVVELPEHFEPRTFDTVVFDPPFDQKQAEEKYDGLHASDVYGALEGFEKLVRPGGVVICFGWNSWGMRSFGAFEREETYLFQRGPIHRDVIATVDRRTSYSLASDGGNARYNEPGSEQEGSR